MQNSAPRRGWRLPASYAPLLFAFYMSAIMGMLMCLVITAATRGVGPGYLASFLRAYALAMPVAFVCVLFVRPLVVKLVGWSVVSDSQ
jgi:sterol desaturase/sphingolipid hydroxylase (fatty acid hydroxylase superfamily)